MTLDPAPLRIGRSGIDVVDRVLREFATSLGLYLRAPFLRGNAVKGVLLPGASTIAVPHGLARAPRGYLVTRVRNVAPASLYDDPARAPDTKYWYFVANSTSTVDFWFF